MWRQSRHGMMFELWQPSDYLSRQGWDKLKKMGATNLLGLIQIFSWSLPRIQSPKGVLRFGSLSPKVRVCSLTMMWACGHITWCSNYDGHRIIQGWLQIICHVKAWTNRWRWELQIFWNWLRSLPDPSQGSKRQKGAWDPDPGSQSSVYFSSPRMGRLRPPQYQECPMCYREFGSRSLEIHVKRCPMKPPDSTDTEIETRWGICCADWRRSKITSLHIHNHYPFDIWFLASSQGRTTAAIQPRQVVHYK